MPPPPPKKQKKIKIAIDDKVTFNYTPALNALPDTPNYDSARILASTVSNYPYTLRNCNPYFKIDPDTQKNKNKF